MQLGTFPRTDEAKRVVIDIETYDPLLKDKGVSYVHGVGNILGVGIKLDNLPAEYYPLHHREGINIDLEHFRNYLFRMPNDCDVVGHYVVYDCGWLNHTFRWLPSRIRCTLLSAQLENNTRQSYSLDALGRLFQLGEKISVDPERLAIMSVNDVAKYCCQDIELTAKLDDKLWQFREDSVAQREFKLIPILVRMKEKGIKIDLEQLDKIQQFFQQQVQEEIIKCGCKDIWAANQVVLLFRREGLNFPRTEKTGKPSFPKWFLNSISNPKIKSLARARELHRLMQFCVGIKQSVANDGRIHPDFFNGRSEYGGTVTGRFSSAHPNVQQIPHRTEDGSLLRSVFLPDGTFWNKLDYSQQEPRFMLHYASKLNLRDIQKWRDIYINEEADFYIPIQNAMGIERFPAKTITLARCYNMGYRKLMRMMDISEEEAKGYLIGFDRTVPWLPELKRFCEEKATNRGWIQSFGGRKLYFSRITAQNSFNHLIQGSAADQIKEAMIQIYEKFDKIPLLQVHDELAYSLDEEEVDDEKEEAMKETMTGVFQLDFPVKVDMKLGLNWRQCD